MHDSGVTRGRRMPDRRPMSGIYDEDPPAQRPQPRKPEPGAPLETTLGPRVVRHLDAISREVGFAVTGVSVQMTPEAVDELIEQVVARVLARIGDVRSSEDPDEWLTTEEAAAFLKVSRQRLYDLNTQRTLRPFKVGRSNRYKRSQLEDFARGGGR